MQVLQTLEGSLLDINNLNLLTLIDPNSTNILVYYYNTSNLWENHFDIGLSKSDLIYFLNLALQLIIMPLLMHPILS